MAKDFFHPVVKAALIQGGWAITHDPYELKVGGVDMVNTFFQLEFTKSAVDESNIKLLIYNPNNQGELRWIPEIIPK